MLQRIAAAICLLLAAGVIAHAGKMKAAPGVVFGDGAAACSTQPNADVCSVRAPSAHEVLSELNDKPLAITRKGKYLDVAFRHDKDFTFGNAPLLGGDVQTPLDSVGPNLWAKRLFIPELDHAALTFYVANVSGYQSVAFSGAHPDHALIKLGASADVKTITIHSKALGRDRDIYVYRGDGCRVTVDGCRVIYFVDGESVTDFFLNKPSEIDTANLVVVGLADPPNDDQFGGSRVAELLVDQHQPDYTRFQTFLTDEVIPEIENSGKPSARYVGGYSNGGAWAASTMLEHPALFQGALVFSAGYIAPASGADATGHSVWIASGKLDSMMTSARKYSKEFSEIHASVKTLYLIGGHSPDVWNAAFWWVISSLNLSDNGTPVWDDDALPCATHPAGEVCANPPPSAQEAEAELKGRTFAMVGNGKFLDVALRHSGPFKFGKAPQLFGDVQTQITQVGDGLWGKRLLLSDVDHAALTLDLGNVSGIEPVSFSGPHADHSLIEPGISPDVEKMTVHSDALGANRDIYVYRGERCRTTVEGCRIIYFADGAEIGTFILNQPKGKNLTLSNLVVVGLADPPNDTNGVRSKRNAELLESQHQPDYAKFQKFLIDEVMPMIEKNEKPSARYVGGYSNGGAWAMDTMLEHPEMFQGALAFSPGLFEAQTHAGASGHTIWIGSGNLEGPFYRDTQKYIKVLDGLHAHVRSRFFMGGHNESTWNALFWWAAGSWN